MIVALKLDKIALKLNAKYKTDPAANFDLWAFTKAPLEGWEEVDHYETTRLGTYRFVWLFREKGNEEGTIFVGMVFNPIKAENPAQSARRIKIEYNPTKTCIPSFLKVYLQNCSCKVDCVQSCDIAFDLEGIRADEIRYKTRGDIMTYGNQKDKSVYLRPSANHGRIKIYDKTAERKKAGKPIEKQIARVEISLHQPDWWNQEEMLPKDLEEITRICDWLQEIAVPTDFHTRIDMLEQKYGRYDPAMLHALKVLPQDRQNEVLGLMSKQARAKYRAAMQDGDYQPLTINFFDFFETAKNLISRAVVYEDLREISHDMNSPHIHKTKIKEKEVESVDSKPILIKL